jgi:transposase
VYFLGTTVFYKNKKNGITYAYESIAYWDKEKHQGRSKRKCIGHIDTVTGEIIPNRSKSSINIDETTGRKRDPKQVEYCKRTFYGATYLFDEIGRKLGITKDLKKCFPDTYEKILSVVYFLILEDRNSLSRFPHWSAVHKHPFSDDIPSQRSSDLFASITEDDRLKFFRLQGKRRSENEYWAYDTSTISSYSKCLKQVQYGHNKEHDLLAQINLALLFGEESQLPFYYRKLPGNITDVKTVKNLLADLDYFGYQKVHMVMDRGFYSEENVNGLYHAHIKFLIGVSLSLNFVKKELEQYRDSVRIWSNYNQEYDIYLTSIPVEWNYTQERLYKGDFIKGKRRMYLHIYFNAQKAVDDELEFTKKMLILNEELESGNIIPEHKKLYEKYFDVKSTPTRGIKVTARQEVMDDAKKNYGYFALISNDLKNSAEALKVYRNKDLIEKAFCNIKERLDCRRLAVSSELSLDGKLFVEFIALIYLSYLKKQMHDQELFKDYTMQSLLDKLDLIECFERPGHELRMGEVTEKHRILYISLGVNPPS